MGLTGSLTGFKTRLRTEFPTDSQSQSQRLAEITRKIDALVSDLQSLLSSTNPGQSLDEVKSVLAAQSSARSEGQENRTCQSE